MKRHEQLTMQMDSQKHNHEEVNMLKKKQRTLEHHLSQPHILEEAIEKELVGLPHTKNSQESKTTRVGETKAKTKNALLSGLRSGKLHKAVDKMEADMAAAEAMDADSTSLKPSTQ